MGEMLLKALVKELEDHPDRLFTTLSGAIKLLQDYPELTKVLTALLKKRLEA